MKYKPYVQDQGTLFPPYLSDFVPSDHPCRIINSIINTIDSRVFESIFQASSNHKGGNLPYDPRMMLKVLIYSYSQGVYSCRKIAKQMKENVILMWLSGSQQPDFRTVNRFRGIYLKDVIPQAFAEVLSVLQSKDLISFETVFVDGTKLEADANKHKVVWRKNTERHKSALLLRVQSLLTEIDGLNTAELARYDKLDSIPCEQVSELNSAELQKIADNISEAISCDGKQSKNATGKHLRKTARQLKHDSQKLSEYESQEKVLSDKNSYSKTDNDARVMKMKNEELRPGYNVQVMAESGFIVGNAVTDNANDSSSFQALMDESVEANDSTPSTVVADAGYGSEEVYEYLEQNDIDNYIKYPSFHAEHSNEKKYKFHYSRFTYNKSDDTFTCPLGRNLLFIETNERENSSGYITESRKYKCYDCKNCPSRADCTKTYRTLTISAKLKKHQKKARERLKSPEGVSLYRRRGFEVETVFGEMKRNQKFRRLSLRGLEKVRTEIGLLCLAHNFKKLGLYLKRLNINIALKKYSTLSIFMIFCKIIDDWGILNKKYRQNQLYGLVN